MIDWTRHNGQQKTKVLLIGCLYVFIAVTSMVVLFVPKLQLMSALSYKEAERVCSSSNNLQPELTEPHLYLSHDSSAAAPPNRAVIMMQL